MSYLTWNTVASLNVTVNGVNIDENCPPGNMNDGLREVIAGVAQFRDAQPDFTTFQTKAAAVFSGTRPKYTLEGAMLNHASAANASGKVSILPEGSPNPTSPANGDIVFFYST